MTGLNKVAKQITKRSNKYFKDLSVGKVTVEELRYLASSTYLTYNNETRASMFLAACAWEQVKGAK